VSEGLAAATPREVPRVFAGSWIHADFSVWIGHPDDRRAWDLLGDARDALGKAAGTVPPTALEMAWASFRAACGSDWCWWYGEEHSSENDYEFDRLFRRYLRAVYTALGLAIPEALDETLITTKHVEVRQSRPTGAVHPVLDGRVTSAEEWVAAGVHRVPLVGTTMRRGPTGVEQIRFGVGDERFHVLVETAGTALALLRRAELALSFPGPTAVRYRVGLRDGRVGVRREERTAMGWVGGPTGAQVAADACLESSIPLKELRPGPHRRLEFRVLLLQGDVELARHPEVGPLVISLEEVTRD
jgi:hypothetical protein